MFIPTRKSVTNTPLQFFTLVLLRCNSRFSSILHNQTKKQIRFEKIASRFYVEVSFAEAVNEKMRNPSCIIWSGERPIVHHITHSSTTTQIEDTSRFSINFPSSSHDAITILLSFLRRLA
jgi:hypothetical protein